MRYAPLLLALAPLLSGCGATTVRVALAPTLDGTGQPGFEATLSLGVGMPLDYAGRSHHFIQALGTIGGGVESQGKKAEVVTGIDVDYIHWAEPKFDLRAGMHFDFRSVPSLDTKLYGFGGHFGIMPALFADNGNWIVSHFAIGPELRIGRLFGDPGDASRTLFSLPLVFELNLLAAGD